VANLGTVDLFGFKINYNTAGHEATPLYNGNIAETEWKTKKDNVLRWYKYGYDALNRITKGISSDGKFDLGSEANPMTYDKNGNILRLYRKGHIVQNPNINNPSDYDIMDNLSYYYNGNQLHSVTDGAVTTGFKDGNVSDTDFNTTADNDYTYDANGNMLKDANKGITAITYNHLNLPTSVTLAGGTISYIYDATGVKLEKMVTEGTTITLTKYAGNYLYQGGTLQFFNHPEGYVENDNGTFRYHYQYKDHLGNIRLSYTNSGSAGSPNVVISEENNYYPFGLNHKGYNDIGNGYGNSVAKKFKFGGKELQDDLIGGKNLDWYDFSARNYDPALGRWMNIDPMAELMYSHSPYNFAFNNPVYFVDLDGMAPSGGNAFTDYYDNGRGLIIYDPNVNGPEDVPDGGTYLGDTYFDKNTGTYWDENGNSHNTTQKLPEVVVTGNSKNLNGSRNWGNGLEDRGPSGNPMVSIDINDLPGIQSSAVGALSELADFMKLLIHAIYVYYEVAPKPNESTMENKVEEEAKNTPEEIMVLVEKTTIRRVDSPYGQQGLRINTSTSKMSVPRKDSLRTAIENRRSLQRKTDSINQVYNEKK